MNKRMIWTGGIAAAVLLAFIFIYFQAFRPIAVVVTTPHRGAAVEAVYATGTVEPIRYARVGTKISGRVTDVLKREGDVVEQGDTLAVIDRKSVV